jgi:hypothetical protein
MGLQIPRPVLLRGEGLEEMNNGTSLALLAAATLIAAIAYHCGREDIQKDALEKGAAQYVCNNTIGECEFAWRVPRR